MRIASLLFGLLFLFSTLVYGQSDEADPYSLRAVETILKLRSGGTKFIFSQNQKTLARLGDRVSIAILKLLGEQDLTNPRSIRDFLPIIRDAFSQPELISFEADKKPGVTLFFLDRLGQGIVDSQTQSEIQQTIDFVRRNTGQ